MILDTCLSGTRLKNRSLRKEYGVVGWTKEFISIRTLLPLAKSDRRAQHAVYNLAHFMKMPTARHAHLAALCCVDALHVHIVCNTVSAALCTCRPSIFLFAWRSCCQKGRLVCHTHTISTNATEHTWLSHALQASGSIMVPIRSEGQGVRHLATWLHGVPRRTSLADWPGKYLPQVMRPTTTIGTSDIDSLAVVENKPEESLMSDVSDARHFRRSDDNDETPEATRSKGDLSKGQV